MNILIISTQNPFRTSGIVAYDLYKVLSSKGNNVKLLIRDYNNYKNEDIIPLETHVEAIFKSWKNKYIRILNRLGFSKIKKVTDPDYHIQDFDQTIEYYNTKKILRKIKFKPKVIIYLFQQNFLNARNLYELNKFTGAKIFWYLLDSAPLTGACHYSWDCKRYTIGCGKCPALYSTEEIDQSSINLRFKNKYLFRTNIEIIVASEWQRKHAKVSLLFRNKPIHKILLSIDPSVYSFVPKKQAKEKLGIPNAKKVIFFRSTLIEDKRKGMKYLVDALTIFQKSYNHTDENIILLIAGRSTNIFNQLPYELRYLGFLSNGEELASAYQAADVFVSPSIEDSGPMMINQSIMTGTPVVAFEMGVAFDLVHSGKTGYKAKIEDSADLAKGINNILDLDEDAYHLMCLNCREMASIKFHPKVVNKHVKRIFNS